MIDSRNIVNIESIKQQLRRLFTENNVMTSDTLRRAAWFLETLARQIDEEAASNKSKPSSSSYGEFAKNYLDEHFRERVRIQDLADMIGVSRGYLTQLMRRTVGLSPQEYLIKLRMEYAAYFLKNTNYSIRDVALECGYEDSLAFSKAFKRCFGSSPSQFRKARKSGEQETDE